MTIIANKVPPTPGLPPDFKHRIVVKFKPDVQLPYSSAAEDEFTKQTGTIWSDLSQSIKGIALVPYFSTMAEAVLERLMKRPPRGEKAVVPVNFRSYYAIECAPGVDPQQVASAVAKWPNVEIAYVEGGPVPPPLNPDDDPRSTNQHYLDAAPAGIDARWAWSQADGAGVRFVDLEQGWILNHEDLAAAGITLISGVSQDFQGHGTAVLGEVMAVDNALGGIGIAPNAIAQVVSQWRNAITYNTAEAILSAVSVMGAGDVLLLEAQTYYGTYNKVPVEVEQAAFDAIQFATSQGIVVVEAAGNGAFDLDTFQDVNGMRILNRNSTDFRDSGAIMVGAASSAVPHQRLSSSNYGSRIDCFAWGQDIDTCGDGWVGVDTNTYTSSFGGSSGASSIVTGAALLMQSWSVANGRGSYSPSVLRELLSAVGLNTASANPSTDRIGVMPNLREIIEHEKRFRWVPYLAWAWLIIIGGLLITPEGTWCIKCGGQDPGYIGDLLVNVLSVVSIGLGVYGLIGLTSRSTGRSLSSRW
jgi:hypothetical protein